MSSMEDLTKDELQGLLRQTFGVSRVVLGRGEVAIGMGWAKSFEGRFLSFEFLDDDHALGESLPLDEHSPDVAVICTTKASAIVLQTIVNALVESFDYENWDDFERRFGQREPNPATQKPVGLGVISEGCREQLGANRDSNVEGYRAVEVEGGTYDR